MHWRTLFIPAFIAILLSIGVYSKSICESGEIGIGYLVTIGQYDFTNNGIIYDHRCKPIAKSSENSWYEGGWGEGIGIDVDPRDPQFRPPIQATIHGKIYQKCYYQNTACVQADTKNLQQKQHDLVFFCCGSKASEGRSASTKSEKDPLLAEQGWENQQDSVTNGQDLAQDLEQDLSTDEHELLGDGYSRDLY